LKRISELIDLNGRVALITGAAGNLGKTFADSLAELGANLILVDMPKISMDDQKDNLIKRWNISVETISCDLEDEFSRSELIKNVLSNYEQLNILLNNAAFAGTTDLEGWITPFEKQSLDPWRRAMEVNLTSIFHLCRDFAYLLRKSKGSSIINISSIYGTYGPDWRLYDNTNMGNPAGYASTKGGLIQLTRWLATTLSPEVRVNAISPGGILRKQPNNFIKKYVDRTPLSRMATEEDFKGIAAYLSSDLSSYVTGQVLNVDGGWGVW
jgi:NAD(P)-dependent dehydrogenase (short-subunit alcohol dehydrogenase family)